MKLFLPSKLPFIGAGAYGLGNCEDGNGPTSLMPPKGFGKLIPPGYLSLNGLL
jgi:hypothetical protein